LDDGLGSVVLGYGLGLRGFDGVGQNFCWDVS